MKNSNQAQIIDYILVNPIGTKINIEAPDGVTLNYLMEGDVVSSGELAIAEQLFEAKVDEGNTRFRLPAEDGVVTFEVVKGPAWATKGVAINLLGTEVVTNNYGILNALTSILNDYSKIAPDNTVDVYHKLPGDVNLRWLTQSNVYAEKTVTINELHLKDGEAILLDSVKMSTSARSKYCTATDTLIVGESTKYVYADAGLNLIYRSDEEVPVDILKTYFQGDWLTLNIDGVIHTYFQHSARMTRRGR